MQSDFDGWSLASSIRAPVEVCSLLFPVKGSIEETCIEESLFVR